MARSPHYSHTLVIRYSECDQQGVVFNAHYQAMCDCVMDLWLRDRMGLEQLLTATTDALGEGVARRVSRGFGSIDIAADVASKQLGRIAAAALDFLDDGLGSHVEVPAGRVVGGFLGASGREAGRARDANNAGAAARGEIDAVSTAMASARGREGGSRGCERGGEHAGARARCFVSHDFFSDPSCTRDRNNFTKKRATFVPEGNT